MTRRGTNTTFFGLMYTLESWKSVPSSSLGEVPVLLRVQVRHVVTAVVVSLLPTFV